MSLFKKDSLRKLKIYEGTERKNMQEEALHSSHQRPNRFR